MKIHIVVATMFLSGALLLSGCGGSGNIADTPTATAIETPPNVEVPKYTIGGSIFWLDSDGLTLSNNDSDYLSLKKGTTSFTFGVSVLAGSAYQVAVNRHPFGMYCALLGSAGTAGVDINSVAVGCKDWDTSTSQVSAFAGGAMQGGYADGVGAAATFSKPNGLAIDSAGNIYVADTNVNLIRKITPEGVVSTFAGNPTAGADDGLGAAAAFRRPEGVAIDSAGNVYVADTGNHSIRKITPAGDVTTLAGGATSGSDDGTGAAATFNNPKALASDANGNLYVADTVNNMIRKVTADGVVTTFAGSTTAGAHNGIGTAATFALPTGIAMDADGNLYVTDFGSFVIRKITPAAVVTTFAGSAHNPGNVDGIGDDATFSQPLRVAVDPGGNLYVADRANTRIRKVSPAGVVTTVAGNDYGSDNGLGTEASFTGLSGIAVDSSGNLYVSDEVLNNIRKVTRIP